MLNWFKQKVSPPIFEDEDQTRKAKLLNAMQLVLLSFMIVVTPILVFLEPEDDLMTLLIIVPSAGVIGVLLYLLHRGHVEVSGWC